MNYIRVLLGWLLLPVAYAATGTLLDLLRLFSAREELLLPAAGWALVAGFSFWLIIFWALPRPMRAYVLAHELTHAFWGLLTGSKVSRLRVSHRGGSVAVSDPNAATILAPYFFPFYTILLLAGYGLASLFWNLQAGYLLWLGLIGLTWSFHITFTISALMQEQSDVKRCGRLFSYALIYIMNLLGLELGLVAVGAPALPQLTHLLYEHSAAAWGLIAHALLLAVRWSYNKVASLAVIWM